MSVLAPATAVVADGVARGVRVAVTRAKSQALHLHMLMHAFCGDCLVRIVGNGLKPFVQSQVRRPR